MTRKCLAWVAICLNFPLWIAVIILAVWESWATLNIIVGCNVALLLTSYLLFTRPKKEERQ